MNNVNTNETMYTIAKIYIYLHLYITKSIDFGH